MFRKARIRLTIIYSTLFLFFFFLISVGIYIWIQDFYHEQFAHEVEQHCLIFPYGPNLCENTQELSDMTSGIALDRLRLILIILNASLFLLVPSSAWLLTGKSLAPVEEAHDREQQFIAAAAHDLRTPLAIMQGELEVTLQKKRKISEYHHVLTSNKEETTRLIYLVENLLFLARLDSQESNISFTEVDILDVLQSILSQYIPIAKKKGIFIEFSRLPKKSIVIEGNKQLLERLFTNLLDNAVKYTPPKGLITLSLLNTGEYAVIQVKDTGIGIASAHQEKIFNPFFRVDAARSEKGYGMGLAICTTIINVHKGEITVASKSGRGATFTAKLPLIVPKKKRWFI